MKGFIRGLVSAGLLALATAEDAVQRVQRDTCPPGFPAVVVSLIEEITVYPVYVSTYVTAETVIVIEEDITIDITFVPTQIVTSGVITTTVTRTETITLTP